MRLSLFIASLAAGGLSVSCNRPPAQASRATSPAPSLEQRVAELERWGGGGKPKFSESEAREEYRRNLAEIRAMGLVDRAHQDFIIRLPGGVIEQWRVGYVFNTNVVWCDVRYRLPDSSDVKQKEFGYQRTNTTNWTLIWDAGRMN